MWRNWIARGTSNPKVRGSIPRMGSLLFYEKINNYINIMIDIILTVSYLLLFLYYVINSRKGDFHHSGEEKYKAIIRRLFFISFFSLVFAALFFVTKNLDVGFFSSALLMTGIIGVTIRAIKSNNKINTWKEHFFSILLHILTLYPVIIYIFYYNKELSVVNLNYTILGTILFILFYAKIHSNIYEHALF